MAAGEREMNQKDNGHMRKELLFHAFMCLN